MILSTVFLRGEFKLENIYSGVNYFLRENVCGKFARPYFGRLLEKSQNSQNVCATWYHYQTWQIRCSFRLCQQILQTDPNQNLK